MLVSDSVTACDELAEIDISPIITRCGADTVHYAILSYKNIAAKPTITADTITFIPQNNDYATAEIVYKVSCGVLSAVGKIIIVYKNECVGITCEESEYCDKCTGICQPHAGDFTVLTGTEINPLPAPSTNIRII